MQTVVAVMPYVIVALLVAVLATLLFGLGTMAKGGEFNARHGNRLMRLRVGLQALTVAMFVIYMLMTKL